MKLIKKKKTIKGFTLTELLVFTAIASVVMVILLSILISFLKSRGTAKKLSALEDVASSVFNELTQEIHWSDAIDPDALPQLLKLIQVQDDETELEVVFEVIESDDIGQLFKKVGGEPSIPISLPEVDINSFTITNLAEPDEIPLLEIQLELQYPDPQKTILSDYKTTISLRKKGFEALKE